MNKVSVMQEIDLITDTYCVDCPILQSLRQTRGKPRAHQFCIKSCTVGEQLQFLGQELLKVNNK